MKKRPKRKRNSPASMLATARASMPGRVWMMETSALEQIRTAILEGSTGRLWDPPPYSREVTNAGGVAYIPVWGSLSHKEDVFTRWLGGTCYTAIEREVKHAAADPDIDRIVLLVDSPGGVAFGCEECATVIRNARMQKPVIAAVRGWCCSAAYYLAAQCDQIVATPSSTIGSVGVIWQWMGVSRAWDAQGVDFELVHHGKDKAFLSGLEAMNDRKRGLIQRWVDEYGDMFESAISKGRGITLSTVKSDFGGGQIWTAEAAMSHGLIDVVDIDAAREAANVQIASSDDGPDAFISSYAKGVQMKWSQRVRHLLFAVGAMPSGTTSATLESVSDDSITMIVSVVFHGQIPTAADGAPDEAAVMAGVSRHYQTHVGGDVPAATAPAPQPAPQPAAGQPYPYAGQPYPAPQPAAAPIAAPAPAPVPGQISQAGAPQAPAAGPQDDPAVRENTRVRELQARHASLTANGYNIPAESLATAVADVHMTVEQAVMAWTAPANAGNHPEQPVRVVPGAAQEDNVHAMLVDSLCLRAQNIGGIANLFEDEDGAAVQVTPGARNLAGAPLAMVFLQAARSTGLAAEAGLSEYSDPRAIALAVLADGPGLISIDSDGATMEGGSINRPGNVGSIMAAVANRMLARQHQTFTQTFERWSSRIDNIADFHPRTLVETIEFGELDQRDDAEKARERQLDGDAVGWFQHKMYANSIGLTIRMVVDNQLDKWARSIASMPRAARRTMNRLHLQLLHSNPELLDGNPMFAAQFNNLITAGGGAPSDAQLQAMRDLLEMQDAPGNESFIEGDFYGLLYPTKHQGDAEKLLITSAGLSPQTPSDINVWNGTGFARGLQPIKDKELRLYDADAWYGLVRPDETPAFVHAYRTGHGPNGNRTTWFEPSSETRWIKVEVHMGAGIAGRRGWVKNPGT